MVWKDDVEVSLTLNGLFRIGSGKAGSEADLPVVTERSGDEGGSSLLVSNMSSSFRGILRKSVRKMTCSTELSSLGELEESVFGTWVTSTKQKEGKLRVVLAPSDEDVEPTNRTSVRIDELFGSAAHGALFTYEALEGKRDQPFLKFILRFNFPLDDKEAAILLAGLNGLLYDSIGGFASRGLGIIEKIKVDQAFYEHALQHLKTLLSKEGR